MARDKAPGGRIGRDVMGERESGVAVGSAGTARAGAGRGARRAGLWAAAGVIVALAVGAGAWAWRGREAPATLEGANQKIAEGRYAQAAREAERVAEKSPLNARAWFTLARARAGMEDYRGCAEALGKIPDWSDRKTEALFRAGMAWRAIHRGRDAEKAFLACIARDPDGQTFAMDSRVELMKLYAQEHRRDEFKAMAWSAYERLPEASRLAVLTMIARIEMEQAKPETDAKSLRALVEGDPDDLDARAGLATALARAGDPESLAAARKELTRVLAEAPDNPDYRERYLDLLHKLGDVDGIRKALADRPPSSEGRPVTLNYLGIVAEKDGDFDAARRYYAAAAEADPREAEYPHRLSLILYRKGKKAEGDARAAERKRLREARGDFRKAWNAFADAYEASPAKVTPEMLLGMARASEACGWHREAAAWYREVLRLAPDDAQAREGLERLASRPPA